MRGLAGHYVPTTYVGETVRAFVPRPLPPEPPLVWVEKLVAVIRHQSVDLEAKP